MTEQMKKALDKAAKGLQWSQGSMLIDKETLQPADPAVVPFNRLVHLPIPDKLDMAAHFGANWYRNNVWHEVEKEMPTYHDDDIHTNQIAVIGDTSGGVSMAVCSMISKDEIYSPVSRKEYKWGECPFTQWAYVEDLLPTPGYKEFSSKIKTEE